MLKLRPILRFGARIASVRRKLVFECVTADAPAAAAGIPLSFRYGDAPDLRALESTAHQYDDPARSFGFERLRAGDRLVLGESAGRVVFYAWLMYGRMDLGVREFVELPPDCAYTYKLFTVPDCRGRRICPAYYTWITRELAALGYRRLLAWVEAGNEASIQAHRRAGFRPSGRIWHVRFLFRSFPILRARIHPRGGSEGAIAPVHP
jgi:L-amino acid N-acyltransferase YncA